MSDTPVSQDLRHHWRRAADVRVRTIIEQLADGIVIVDDAGIVRFANPAAEALFGRPADELVGQVFGFPIVDGETAEIDLVRRGGAPVVAELRIVEAEWEGDPAYLLSLRDVTDRREAEERARQAASEQAARKEAQAAERQSRFLSRVSAELSSSLDYHSTLVNLAHLAVPHLAEWCIIDVVEPAGTLRRVAFAHEEPEKEKILSEIRDRFPPNWKAPFPGAQALRTGEPVFYRDVPDSLLETLTQDADHFALVRSLGVRSLMAVPLVARAETLGAITFACGARSYRDSDFALAQDFAQRAALSISNARLYQQAQQANRAKAEFLGVMSHELRTPLNAILGYTDLLEGEVSGTINDQQREQLLRIRTSARHLLNLVEEILSFTRMEAGRETVHPEQVDLRELARNVAALMEPLARNKGLSFEVQLSDKSSVVETDPSKVRQILLNLLSNAVKFTRTGGIRLELTPDGGDHLIRVSDTGIGIPAEQLDRIFEPFSQVEQSIRREVEGTGLGLSVAQELAQLLGGDLTVESTLGRGSTFTLRVPARPPAASDDA